MKTQEEINNTIVDVVYDNEQIYHILEPEYNGVRGIPRDYRLIRDSIESVRIFLVHLDQSKIDFYEEELRKGY